MKKKKETKDDIWRSGYDLGVRVTLKENDDAIKIGRAILEVLNERYERIKEEY